MSSSSSSSSASSSVLQPTNSSLPPHHSTPLPITSDSLALPSFDTSSSLSISNAATTSRPTRSRKGRIADPTKSCHICQTSKTSLWRKATIDGLDVTVCNACGIKWKTNAQKQAQHAAAVARGEDVPKEWNPDAIEAAVSSRRSLSVSAGPGETPVVVGAGVVAQVGAVGGAVGGNVAATTTASTTVAAAGDNEVGQGAAGALEQSVKNEGEKSVQAQSADGPPQQQQQTVPANETVPNV